LGHNGSSWSKVIRAVYLNGIKTVTTPPKLAPDKHGLIWLPAEAYPAAFAQNASPEEQAELEALQRPISPACITAPVGRPLWMDIPAWYLLAVQDHMIVPHRPNDSWPSAPYRQRRRP
jgi:hypothetical protein